ncbi:MAG: AAA family ATPase [Limisphaerales bacterium]
MQATASTNDVRLTISFVGRGREIARLRQLHKQRKHVLILGPAGVGKSALVARLRESLDLRVCPASERLSEICEALEREFDLEAGDLHIVQRKNRLLKLLKGIPHRRDAVVFDGASWTTPKLGNFIENVTQRAPVWLCARSERSWDIGHIWPLLVRFEHVELKPFHPSETQKLVEAAIRQNSVPEKTLEIVDWLHRRAAGNPKILCELLTEIARGHYDLSNAHALRLLNLDRRIHELFPTA